MDASCTLTEMSSLPRPQVICTHESDLDGLVAGLLLLRLARKLFAGDVRLEAHHYQGWKNRQMVEESAWVTDFSFDSRLDRGNWLVVDHHATEAKAEHASLIHDAGKSAARLCYELCEAEGLGNPRLDRLVHLTNVGDLFLIEDVDFALACDYASLVKTYGFWPLHALIQGDPEKLLDHPLLEVMTVKRRIEDPMGYDWARKHIEELSPQVALVQTVVGNTNLIVHRLLEEKAVPYSVLVTFFRKGNNQMVVSFRSQNGEALKVASQFQGGGHPNAAGTTLPQSVRDHEAAAFYLKQALSPRATRGAGLNSLESAFSSLRL